MSHWYIQNGFFVVQIFGYRFEVIDRKRNPVLSTTVFPCYGPRDFRVMGQGISVSGNMQLNLERCKHDI
jgi:hypothetical protein